MASEGWKDWNNFFADPWHHGLMPYWRHQHPFSPFSYYGVPPHKVGMMVPRDLNRMEHSFRPMAKRWFGDMAPTVDEQGNFRVCVDVHQFNPSEIDVNFRQNSVVVEAKHEEREDEHGFIVREFCRRYELPQSFDPDSVTSELTSDGILIIKAHPKLSKERIIKIEQHSPPRVHFKEARPIETQSVMMRNI